MVKTKECAEGQIGTFDDATRGVTGGNLLGASYIPSYNHTYSTEIYERGKYRGGDTKMTGVNRERAKWGSSKEYDKRKEEGLCLRCGKAGHIIGKYRLFPSRRPTTAVKPSMLIDRLEENDLDMESNLEETKE